MGEQRINAVALGVVLKDGHVLLQRLSPRLIESRPYRPIGGFIEFGERAADAVVREYREELGRRVEVVRLLTPYEHLAEFTARAIHEVSLTFELRFAPGDEPDDLSPLPLYEQDARPDEQHDEVAWVPLEAIERGEVEVYPRPLFDLILATLQQS
jgi:ADP-ribose pyrophosphatase YjhB (NUDIX family)